MHRRIRSTSSWPEILLIARYCRSKHILANRFSWYLRQWISSLTPFRSVPKSWQDAASCTTVAQGQSSVADTCSNWPPPGPPSDPLWRPGPAPGCSYCGSLYCCCPSRTTTPPPRPPPTQQSFPQAAHPQSQTGKAPVCGRIFNSCTLNRINSRVVLCCVVLTPGYLEAAWGLRKEKSICSLSKKWKNVDERLPRNGETWFPKYAYEERSYRLICPLISGRRFRRSINTGGFEYTNFIFIGLQSYF